MEPQSGSASFNREQVINVAKNSLNFFAPLLMPAQFIYEFPSLHLVAWDFFLKAVADSDLENPTPQQKFPQIALGWPRGHLKTTLIKLLACWLILFSKKKFILVVGSNLLKAKNIVADIMDMLSEDNILNLWGSWNVYVEKDTENLKKFTFCGRDIVIGAIGAGGDPRGLNVKNERPDVILMDDIQSREDSESLELSKKLLLWMNGTLKKAKSPHGCIFVFVGNMFSSQGCILKIIKRNPEWLSVIVPGILSSGEALWPELRSKDELLQELKEDIAMGTPEVFFSEIMNDEQAGVTSCFDITKVPYCPYAPTDNNLTASFMIIDVAGDKVTSDDTSIIFYEVHDAVPVASILKKGKFSPKETIRHTLTIAIQRGCPVIGVESVAYQASLLFWFEETCKETDIQGIQFVELHPKGRSKNSRILTMFKSLVGTRPSTREVDEFSELTQVEEGKPYLYLRDDLRPAVFWEITQFRPQTKNNEDNVIDNLAYAQDMMQDYLDLMWNPVSAEAIAFSEAKVVENNYAF